MMALIPMRQWVSSCMARNRYKRRLRWRARGGGDQRSGGLMIAREPQSAKLDGMPPSAIATGFMDAILPANEIGPRILSHLL